MSHSSDEETNIGTNAESWTQDGGKRTSVPTSWNVFWRNNKKFVKTNDRKPYLTSVSGVDKFWVRGELDTALCGTISSVELGVGL